MSNTLKGKTAVVTGASSGIGEAAVKLLAAEGVNVIATARRKNELNRLAAETNCSIIAGDITDKKLPEILLNKALTDFGSCDIVVNNAGLLEADTIENIDLERVSEMVSVNVDAAFRMIYTFLKYFKSVDNGNLINISSVLGTKVRITAGAYAGTKHAIDALSEALRMELCGTNIKITNIEPGLVMTGLHSHLETHPTDSMEIKHPLMPEDVAVQIIHVLKQAAHVRIPKLMILPSDHVI